MGVRQKNLPGKVQYNHHACDFLVIFREKTKFIFSDINFGLFLVIIVG